MEVIKQGLISQLSQLDNVYVSLVTFNHNVMLNDLKNASPFTQVIGGKKQYTMDKLIGLMGLKVADRFVFQTNKYVVQIDECKSKLINIIKNLQSEQFAVKRSNRVARCTGQAMMVSAALVHSFGGIGGRVLNIISGPCTRGPGMIIEESLSKTH